MKSRLATKLPPIIFAVASALVVQRCAPAVSAEEMTDAEAIAEIERLGGFVRDKAPPDFRGMDKYRELGRRDDRGRRRSRDPGPMLRWAYLGERFGDEELRLLKHVSSLQAVTGLNGKKVTDAGIKELAALPPLRSIVFRGDSPNITNRGLEYLDGIPTLTELELRGAPITPEGFKDLGALANLEVLVVSGRSIDDAAVAHLGSLAKLEWLTLENTSVTDAGLAHLQPLTRLLVLDVSSDRLTDGAIAQLRRLTKLAQLRLSGGGIGDAALKDIKDLPQLLSLSLDHTAITDAGLRELRALPELQELSLAATHVTDEGLRELKIRESLRLKEAAKLPESQRRYRQEMSLRAIYLAETDVTAACMDDLQVTIRVRIMSWPGQSEIFGDSGGRRVGEMPKAGK